MKTQIVSKQTQRNWWIDIILFTSAVIAAITGIYFLFLPSGGYQGGWNPYYNVQILFQRETWDDLHTWGGLIMIAIVVIHLVIHWSWIVSMVRKAWNGLSGKAQGMSYYTRLNLSLNILVAINFFLTAASGVYFFIVPGGRRAVDPMFLFSRTTWDLIHTWAGVALIIAALVHIAIHWKWITKVTGKMMQLALTFRSSVTQSSFTN
jgi:hypothetical protein